ncbi:ArsR/SmtB family transcription factor [Calidithermus chliarophilus]|uniref:ArsR/SmtB family transcription factor n=1 Tax=Calidithermus chliarophilus TaxID=52023 RepID=UPI000425DEC9|nr:metalloregulator ArsR/SmtB family transcription factor [Calidithermus chliarophilus]
MDPTRKRRFKQQLFDQFARLGKALANNHRLELIELLAQGERSVESLAREADLSVANASQHLQVLHAAGLVEQRREGVFAYYSLTPGAFPLWQALRDLARQRLAEVERLVESTLEREGEPVGLEELARRLEHGDAVLLDVRPLREFEAGHIPGAIPAPVAELEALLPSLPRGVEVIAYCRGPYCTFADEAVELLRARGFNARRLELGLPDWRAAGYPVRQGVGA